MLELPQILSFGLLVLFPRGVGWYVPCVIMLCCPAFIWTSDCVSLLPSAVTAEDCNAWPFSVGTLVKWVTVLGTLHWPAADLAVGGVSLWRCFSCMSSALGSDLICKKLFHCIVDVVVQFQCRLFFFFGPGIDIWRSCRFTGALM